MVLTKETIIDKYEIVSEFKHIQCREATIIKEDGVEISRNSRRYVLTPDLDVTSEIQEIQDVSNVLWTQAVKDAWQAKLDVDI